MQARRLISTMPYTRFDNSSGLPEAQSFEWSAPGLVDTSSCWYIRFASTLLLRNSIVITKVITYFNNSYIYKINQ